jgi:thioredoxin-like negative regulator of GroEL
VNYVAGADKVRSRLQSARGPRMPVTNVANDAANVSSRRRVRLVLALVGGAGLVTCGWVWSTFRSYYGEMESIESEVVAGRYAIACRRLEELLSRNADRNGQIAYLLGSCELARGRYPAAAAAWARVAPGSAFSHRAIEAQMHLYQEAGQLATAEELVTSAALDPRNGRTALLVLLVPMYCELGRTDEAERLIEDRWEDLSAAGEGALEPAIKLVRQHVELTLKELPIDSVRRSLERSAQRAPDDDRVWLGRANLAIRMGAHDQALRWLDACLARRPHDQAIWRARLCWGIATNRVDVVKQAITHLPTAETNPALVHRTSAWLARERGDAAAERRELELVLESDPADETALARLAHLAQAQGQTDRATGLLAKKAAIIQLRARYLQLHDRIQPIRDSGRLARLAEQLGRRFEARAFQTIRASDTQDADPSPMFEAN